MCKETFEKCLQKNHIQLIEELTLNENNKYKKLRGRAVSQQSEMFKVFFFALLLKQQISLIYYIVSCFNSSIFVFVD